MKKITLVLIALFIGIGVYFSYILVEPKPRVVKSQQGIDIDISSKKDFFEYSLSAIGEESLDIIKSNVESNTTSRNHLGIDDELFELYIKYKESLVALEGISNNAITLTELKQLNDMILLAQKKFFTDAQIEELFAEENRVRQLAIDKLEIESMDIDGQLKQELLEDMLATQPEYIKKAERNNILITQLAQTSALNSQEKYLKRVSLVGEEAAQRLQSLDEQRKEFDDTLKIYLEKRQNILNNISLGDEEKRIEISRLREQSFTKETLRRVEALERIYDSES